MSGSLSVQDGRAIAFSRTPSTAGSRPFLIASGFNSPPLVAQNIRRNVLMPRGLRREQFTLRGLGVRATGC